MYPETIAFAVVEIRDAQDAMAYLSSATRPLEWRPIITLGCIKAAIKRNPRKQHRGLQMVAEQCAAGSVFRLTPSRVRGYHPCRPQIHKTPLLDSTGFAALTETTPGPMGLQAGDGRKYSGNLGHGDYYAVMGFVEPVQRYYGAPNPILVKAYGEVSKQSTVPLPRDCIGVQLDVAFEMSRDYPRIGEDVSIVSASTAVARVYPVLVVITGLKGNKAPSGIISGARLLIDAEPLSLMDLDGELDIRTAVYRSGVAVWDITSMLAQPANGFLWAADQLRGAGARFKKGDVVSVGASPVVVAATPDNRVVVDLAERTGITHSFVDQIRS